MGADTVLAFTALAAVIIAIPGPAVILVLKSVAVRGRSSAVVTALGVLTADLVWALASVVGLTAFLVSSQLAFDALRIAGAAYLIYLGIRLILTREFRPADVAPGSAGKRVPWRRAYVEGLLNDLSNPKTVLVYASVIPQFLTSSSTAGDAFVLGVVFAVLGFCSLLTYAVVLGTAGAFVRNATVMRRLLRGGGGILAVFGVALLVERPAH